jgi:hypothetical protein
MTILDQNTQCIATQWVESAIAGSPRKKGILARYRFFSSPNSRREIPLPEEGICFFTKGSENTMSSSVSLQDLPNAEVTLAWKSETGQDEKEKMFTCYKNSD